MLKLSQSIIFAVVAFNFTAFAVMLQMNLFSFGTLTVKIIAWAVTAAAWRLTYMRRNKYFTLF